MSTTISNLKNTLLIAMPSLDDPMFARSVAYIFEHSELGAMGLVINKPLDMNVAEIFDLLEIPVTNPELHRRPVLQGGPVNHEHGIILHRENSIGGGEMISRKHRLVISTSKDDLFTIPQAQYSDILVSLGHAGWMPGQLEDEILNNDWLVAPLDPKILFELPIEQRWAAAAQSIGVDISKLSLDAGHA